MASFHHQKLPHFSTLLAGHTPPNAIGFTSKRLQIWYNNTEESWTDEASHAHQESDECFIVLQGSILVEVKGERFIVGPREFCCFPQGVYHQVVESYPPIECLMLRSPSVNDKIYQYADETMPE